MRTTTRNRILVMVPAAMAVLALSACGMPCMAGSNASGATPTSSSSGGGLGGFGSGSGGGSASTAGMTADQVASYCKAYSDALPYSADIAGGVFDQLKLGDLRKATPVELTSNVDVLMTDGRAITRQTRVYAQLRDEITSAVKSLADFHDQICLVH